jgi:hypothetical protein
MELTQQDFEERLSRAADGDATDEDRRLIKHYRDQGYQHRDEPADGSWLASQQQTPVNNETPDESDNDSYASMEYRDLQSLTRQRGLNAGGSATDLIKRLRENDEKTKPKE